MFPDAAIKILESCGKILVSIKANDGLDMLNKETSCSGKEWEEAFGENTKHLELVPDCANTWVKLAVLIMIDDHPEQHEHSGIESAERCILRALEINPDHLEALEEAAYFYDVMVPDRAKAVMYAQRYIDIAGKVLEELQAIVDNSN